MYADKSGNKTNKAVSQVVTSRKNYGPHSIRRGV